MINLHPSLLPNYKEAWTPIPACYNLARRYHGCSVHLVTSELDAGEVIAQAVTCVNAAENASQLRKRSARACTMEHTNCLPMVVGLLLSGLFRLTITNSPTALDSNLPIKLWL
ncbi:MAG: formyltransferase family protein [Moraxella sp.]